MYVIFFNFEYSDSICLIAQMSVWEHKPLIHFCFNFYPQPMHDDYDLRQEQLNKTSLLSSKKFLENLLDLFSTHVVSVWEHVVMSACSPQNVVYYEICHAIHSNCWICTPVCEMLHQNAQGIFNVNWSEHVTYKI